MKRKLLIYIILILCCFACNNYQSDDQSPTADSGKIVMEIGDNRFEGEIVSEYEEDLRIYGVNPQSNNGEWSPVAYATYLLVALPVSETNTASDCERDDAQRAPVLNLIVKDEALKEKMMALDKVQDNRRATVIGEKITITSFKYKGEDHSSVLKPSGKIDPRNAIIVTDVQF